MTTMPAPHLASVTSETMRLLVSRTRPPKLAEYLADTLDAELVPLGSAGAKTMAVVLTAVQLAERDVPDYMTADHEGMKGTFIRAPQISELPVRRGKILPHPR